MITIEDLAVVMRKAPIDRLALFVDPLNAAMYSWAIDEQKGRVAQFLAQVAVESQELQRQRENLNYSAEGLALNFSRYFRPGEARDFAHQPERIANRVYANRFGNGDEASGDGWRFRGGGILGLTFSDNYRDYSIAAFGDTRMLAQPETIEQPEIATDSGAWFFAEHGCNERADNGDFLGVCVAITGGANRTTGKPNGYDERLRYWSDFKMLLGVV